MAQKKRDAGGFAAIASIVNYKLQDGTRRLIYSAYITTRIETNCVLLSYNPPLDFSKDRAAKVWNSIIDSISKK